MFDAHPLADRIPDMRRPATKKERLTKCEACGYPLSQRHHLLSVSCYGESELTVQLCANCHELWHLIQASAGGSKQAMQILGTALMRIGLHDKRWNFLYPSVEEASAVELAVSKMIVQAAEERKKVREIGNE